MSKKTTTVSEETKPSQTSKLVEALGEKSMTPADLTSAEKKLLAHHVRDLQKELDEANAHVADLRQRFSDNVKRLREADPTKKIFKITNDDGSVFFEGPIGSRTNTAVQNGQKVVLSVTFFLKGRQNVSEDEVAEY